MRDTQDNLSDLIPIKIHYDSSTLLTANGELIQIIKVTGNAKRFKGAVNDDLRDIIKQTIKPLLSKEIMFYLYVKRDFTDIDSGATHFMNDFARKIHTFWIESNSFNKVLMNTLYIAVVHSGAKDMFNTKTIFQNLLHLEKRLEESLERASIKLSEIAIKILGDLEAYGAQLLSIVEKNNTLVSEPLSFLHYLVHLYDKDIEIERSDFSHVLANNLELKANYNILTVHTDESDGKNADLESAIFTIKGVETLPISLTDQILSLDYRLIITESVKISDKKLYLDKLNATKLVYEASANEKFINDIQKKIDEVTQGESLKKQISVIVSATSDLPHSLKLIKEIFFANGISLVREDYYMNGAFLGIFPGNSPFFRREDYCSSENIACFGSIKPKSLGKYNGSVWGPPVTIFNTVNNLTYFFNFHNVDNIGHSIVISNDINRPDLMLALILLESFKFNPLFIDLNMKANKNVLLENCNGTITGEISVDLFILCKDDKEVIRNLLLNAIQNKQNFLIEEKKLISSTIDEVVVIMADAKTNNTSSEKISEDIDILISSKDLMSDTKKYLVELFKDYFKYLNADSELPKGDILGIDNRSLNIKSLHSFLYIKKLNNVISDDNTKPYIIKVSADLLSFVCECNLKEEFTQILLSLSKKSSIVIFECDDRRKISKECMEIINKAIPTRFFLSDKFVDKQFKESFNLSEAEINRIKMYEPSERIFLLKQDEYSISASFKIIEQKLS